jgi:hypothetical protein
MIATLMMSPEILSSQLCGRIQPMQLTHTTYDAVIIEPSLMLTNANNVLIHFYQVHAQSNLIKIGKFFIFDNKIDVTIFYIIRIHRRPPTTYPSLALA